MAQTEPTTRTQPVCDEILNLPLSRGLKAAVLDYAQREGDPMTAVARKALCYYLGVDLAGVPRGEAP